MQGDPRSRRRRAPFARNRLSGPVARAGTAGAPVAVGPPFNLVRPRCTPETTRVRPVLRGPDRVAACCGVVHDAA